MKEDIFNSINIAEVLSDQIQAKLDLMMMTNDSVDIKSINTAAEMVLTMHDELMVEVNKLYELAASGICDVSEVGEDKNGL